MNEELETKLNQFLAVQSDASTPVVCITSGGTIVPLESNMCRFIDNFSSGLRGATSAECFLAHGYAVIYVHRTGSAMPFTTELKRNVSAEIDNNLLEKLQYKDGNLFFNVSKSAKRSIGAEIDCYKEAVAQNVLITIPYQTISEYLLLLEQTALKLRPFDERACFYLAAAVSDFYLPISKMPHHKMQSSEGLELKLDQVPKMLAKLTSEWAPKSYVVSFKLETDEAILIKKAENSIISYNVNLVIANLLHTRRDSCLIVERNSDSATLGNNGTTKHDNSFSITEIVSHPSMMQVEVSLVQEVSSRHFTHFKASGGITDSTSWMPTDQVTPSVRKLRKHIFAKYDRTLEDAYNTVQDEVRSAIDLTKPILISLVVGIAAFYLGRATAR